MELGELREVAAVPLANMHNVVVHVLVHRIEQRDGLHNVVVVTAHVELDTARSEHKMGIN